MDRTYVIGVAGGTASGKTTIVQIIKEYFGDNIELIGHDCYYKAHDDMPFAEREKLNYDHPQSFDTERMVKDVLALKEGRAVERPVYDYAIHNRSKETVTVYPKKILMLEGILILESEALRDLMDLKIFVDTDADERLMRRITRDMAERGRSVESILRQYRTTVKPMHEQFIEPSKKYADLIIPRGGKNTVAIAILKHYLKKILSGEEEE
ncbi:MAG: uridine kinase [Lachnospiraceae bacterium]|nr:uridine kinase [Lachnospiraceae bacterium]